MEEIERKFRVCGDVFKTLATKKMRITQGYLCSEPECTVRVRLKGDVGFITIKGASSCDGTTRFEWEKPIEAEEALQLLALCEEGVIDKTRYVVPNGNTCIEVDVFHKDNEGLVVAEIELATKDTAFERPEWLGEEVTGDTRYYNAMLSKNPYKNWGGLEKK